MSFGFSVGDFLAVLQLVNGIRQNFIGAPEHFNRIYSEYVPRNFPKGFTSLLTFNL